MPATVSIIMPAYRAQTSIAAAVASLLAQTRNDWELLVIADDGVDYRVVLDAAGIRDPRCRFLSTGKIGSGAVNARNLGIDAAATDFLALLDADDRFKPTKLATALPLLENCPIVTTALDVVSVSGQHLRHVGVGPDRTISAGAHKWTNFSMDAMLLWDRRACDPRGDTEIPALTDLEFLLRLFAVAPACCHLGTPLHDYVKQPDSISNGTGMTERMVAAKTALLERLAAGYYPFADPNAAHGIAAFLEISLAAEHSFATARAARPGLLFEDHLEPMLNAKSTSLA